MNKLLLTRGNSFSSKNAWLYTVCFLFVAVTCLFPELSLADTTGTGTTTAKGFGQMGLTISENTKGIAKAVEYLGYTGGVGSAVWGCFDMYNAGNGRGNATYADGGRKIMIGAGLLGLFALLGAGSATMFGTDNAAGGLKDLGL